MFHDVIAGIYETNFWKKLFALLPLIIPSLILALGLQRIFGKGINRIKDAIEETEVMAIT